MALLIVFCWLLIILCSLVGWGKAALFLCGESADSWAISGAVGIGVVVSIGGLLNMAGLVKRPVLLLLVGAGALLFLVFVIRTYGPIWSRLRGSLREVDKRPLLLLLCLLLVGISAFRVYGSLRSMGSLLKGSDDRMAYCVFPEKMLVYGSYAPDPFSERRIVTNLGGGIFLSAFPLLLHDDLRNLLMMDQGVGFLLLLLACVGMLRKLRIGVLGSVFFLLCVSLTVIYPNNSSICLVGTGVLMACVLILGNGPFCYRKAIVVGVTMGALCTCKSTFIAPVVSIYFCFMLLTLVQRGNRGRILLMHATTTIAALLVIAPWSYEMKRTSGTWLYPYLGRGYHATAYGLIPALSNILPAHLLLTKLAVIELPLCAAFAWMMWRFKKSDLMATALASTVGGGALATFLIAYAISGAGIRRYITPFVIPAVWAIVLYFLRPAEDDGETRSFDPRRVFVATLLALFTTAQAGSAIRVFRERAACTRSGAPLVSSAVREEAIAAQNAVPPGENILAHLEYNFVLDFKRNNILILDWPGTAGPPPGPPLGQGPEALSAYLMNQSVRYVAYAYVNQAGDTEECLHSIRDLTSTSFDPWVRQDCIVMADFHSDFLSLGKTRRRLFDDGHMFLLDLATHSVAATTPLLATPTKSGAPN